ncbi:DUF4932 domain-containing protein [Mucilaginibacter lacusdianchii]|uniref:DUF4932 domain-containing protein n=1 Tax=Mucilaginibacter lacusdianchii TaxID=2684211 RepID=UPI00131A809B|nr:DUF4932 domain-containing protein [Mucilaginibacter sp. JXJ CY 39]
MKKIYLFVFLFLFVLNAFAQYKVRLAENATVGVSPNVETYFFAEKLAVEHISNYVFDIKGTDYSHQPIVYYGFKHFKRFENDPIIIRTAEILKQIRDTLYDNGPILTHLLNQNAFPAKGQRFINEGSTSDKPVATDKLTMLLTELTDSLIQFYVKADVGSFLNENSSFYKGALAEIAKDIDKAAYPAIEEWYGKKFPRYELYISPAMPITPGEDSYRGFGPNISSPHGQIPSMVISSSKMLKLQGSLPLYRQYGFDNSSVTQFITIHEISHSFVNPLLEKYAQQIRADSGLFVKELSDTLAPLGIRDWYVCVTEHLVRLGEIRIAMSLNNTKEADRLRKLHIGEYHCVLLPLLEKQVARYEVNRTMYPTFESFLPELIKFLHSLTPQIVKDQVLKYHKYTSAFQQ